MRRKFFAFVLVLIVLLMFMYRAGLPLRMNELTFDSYADRETGSGGIDSSVEAGNDSSGSNSSIARSLVPGREVASVRR